MEFCPFVILKITDSEEDKTKVPKTGQMVKRRNHSIFLSFFFSPNGFVPKGKTWVPQTGKRRRYSLTHPLSINFPS